MLDTLCELLDGGVLEGVLRADRTSAFCAETLFQFYPQLDRARLASLDSAGRREYLDDTIGGYYRRNERSLGDAASRWQLYWDTRADAITAAFEESFDMELDRRLRRVTCSITLDPSCPHDTAGRTFDLFYLNSERGACGLSLRELAQMIWFEKWHDHFGDPKDDYESPGLKWIFSAMSLDAVLSHPTLAALNPYRGRSCPVCFYPLRFDGQPALDVLARLWRENTVTGYMEQGFKLCIANEKSIHSAMC